MAEMLGNVLAFLIVLGAAVYVVAKFSGAFDRWRRARKPDVDVKSLVRKKGEKPQADEDCCR